jgi:hypothetical protein
LWSKRSVKHLAPLLVKDNERHIYNAARDVARVTGIPLRQIRRVVEAYAFWIDGWSDQGSSANGNGRTLTATSLALDKKWEELARVILEDLEDLQLGDPNGDAWVGSVFGCESEEMKSAVRKCRGRWFSCLAFGEKGGCGSLRRRLERRAGKGIGKGNKREEKRRRKVEWCLCQEERDSMDGKVELIKEMRGAQVNRRDGHAVREARVAEKRYVID